ncbi:MAG TPA: hypothetical protein VKI64_06485 [Acidimicrobiales bacterium]|nr:hypothetical protein [Acidimicrobiales bacterium]
MLVLLYGEPATRRGAVLRFLAQPGPAPWSTLATTVWSTDPWLLRARALEALGAAAGHADERTAMAILDELLQATRDLGGEPAPDVPGGDRPTDPSRP